MLTPLLTFYVRGHKFCLRAYLVLHGAYAGLRSQSFSYATPLQGPLPEHEPKGLEHGSIAVQSPGSCCTIDGYLRGIQ